MRSRALLTEGWTLVMRSVLTRAKFTLAGLLVGLAAVGFGTLGDRRSWCSPTSSPVAFYVGFFRVDPRTGTLVDIVPR